jgi:hypothetical protein
MERINVGRIHIKRLPLFLYRGYKRFSWSAQDLTILLVPIIGVEFCLECFPHCIAYVAEFAEDCVLEWRVMFSC